MLTQTLNFTTAQAPLIDPAFARQRDGCLLRVPDTAQLVMLAKGRYATLVVCDTRLEAHEFSALFQRIDAIHNPEKVWRLLYQPITADICNEIHFFPARRQQSLRLTGSSLCYCPRPGEVLLVSSREIQWRWQASQDRVG